MSSLRLSHMGVGLLGAISLGCTSAAMAEESARPADEITVSGSQVALGDSYEGGQVARTGRLGMLGNSDFMDAPFILTSYTSALIEQQQAASVADVLQNDPTVRVAKGFGNFQELYMIRGFPVYSDDMTLNGVYGILPRQFVAAEMLERVEVLRGANTFLNGAAPGGSAVGGMVNLVPKRAGHTPLTRVTGGVQGDGQGYAALDVARRFGDDEANGVRVNLVGRDGKSAVAREKQRLGALSVGFDHRRDRLQLSADIGYQDHHIDAPRPSVTPGGATLPAAPSASKNYAQDWTYADEKQLFGVVRGEYLLNDNTRVWLGAGARQGKEHNLLANPTADGDGGLSAFLFENVRQDNVLSADVGVRHDLITGSINHTLTLSAAAYQLRSKNAWAMSSTFSGFGTLNDMWSVARPEATFFGGSLSDARETERNSSHSVALADTLGMLEDKIKLTLGGRWQRLETRSYDYDSGALSARYGKNALTPFVGALYQPSLEVALFANYAEALLPSGVAPATSNGVTVSNAGQVFAPFRAQQIEAGAKYDNGMFGASVSLFQITRPEFRLDGTTYTDNGEQRNRGIELTLFGKPHERVTMLGGVTLLDARQQKSSPGGQDGKRAIGVPAVQANLNLGWETPFIDGLALEGRAVYTASQYADAANTLSIPAWVRVDLGARYALKLDGHDVTLRARVENLSDKRYWSSVGGYQGSNYLVQGNPRTVIVSASYDF
ncbi:TonB-dependent receptor [Edwardsiella ictaluri]|uniref:TonB-dependent receptor n=1 Tax=Edwardsiella ictaluri TaxID=67780 RepID=UPI003783BAEB